MNVGIYCRVSSETQVQKGESLAEQERDGRAWARANSHHVVAVYSDPGRRGTLPAAERPGLLEALEALEAGLIDTLVIRDLDRLSRKLTVQEAVLEQVWQRADTQVIEYPSGREVLRDDPDDPMRAALRQMAGVFKELDRAMVAKRLRDGRRNKARKGQHPNGPAPFGWRSASGELVPVPVELAALARMRELAATGLRQADVASALNSEGHATRNGGQWSQPVVGRILKRDAARTPEQVAYHAAQLAKHGSADVA